LIKEGLRHNNGKAKKTNIQLYPRIYKNDKTPEILLLVLFPIAGSFTNSFHPNYATPAMEFVGSLF